MALLALVLAILVTSAQPAHAYIDPGSGSLLLQAAIATLAGAGFATVSAVLMGAPLRLSSLPLFSVRSALSFSPLRRVRGPRSRRPGAAESARNAAAALPSTTG